MYRKERIYHIYRSYNWRERENGRRARAFSRCSSIKMSSRLYACRSLPTPSSSSSSTTSPSLNYYYYYCYSTVQYRLLLYTIDIAAWWWPRRWRENLSPHNAAALPYSAPFRSITPHSRRRETTRRSPLLFLLCDTFRLDNTYNKYYTINCIV